MSDETHHGPWAPIAADAAAVGRLLDDLSYPAHLTALGERGYVLVAANRAALEVLGRSRSDACGRELGELIGDTDALQEMSRHRDQALETLRPVRYDLHVDLPVGHRTYDTTLVPVANRDGRGVHVFAIWRDTTSQHEAEADRELTERALRESEARSRAILQATPDVIVTVQRDGTLVTVDGRVTGLLNRPEGPRGQRIPDIYPPDATERIMGLVNGALDTGELHTDEILVDFDGFELLIEARVVPLGPDLALGIGRDVTERKRSEEALRRSEERFRALVQHTSDVITVLDAEARTVYVSPAVAMFGWNEESLVGTNAFDLVHPDDRDRVAARFFAGLVDQRNERVEYRLLTRDGSWRDVETIGNNLLDNSAVHGVVLTTRDVTDRKRSDEVLRQSEERFRALVQNTSDMISVLDAEGRIVYASPAHETVLGLSIPEWLGRAAFDLVHPDDLERVAARFAHAVAEAGLTEPVEFRMRRADGSWCHIEGIGNSLFHDPSVGGMVVTSRDVTERKRLEAQLLQAQKMEAVGQLAGGVAHDFNNLLTAITGYTALLLDATAESDPRREELQEIAHAGTRATQLVDQLLSFSRRKMVQPTKFDLGEVVESMRSLVDRLLPADIEVVTRLGAGLHTIEADRSQVEQVLMNLVVNARDAMAEGGRLLIETTETRFDDDSTAAAVGVSPGGYGVLAVSDNGIGMDADTRARVFEPFFTTKDVGQGTGLGLSTIYGIVTQAGGNVTVYSEPGRGTTFRVYLPSVEAGVDGRSGEQTPVKEQAGGTETILLVEDEAAVRALAGHVLAQLGYSVLEAADGQHALEVADAHAGRIDLLVTDIVLPRTGGIEVAEKLTADHPHLRVLFTSGYTETAIGHDSEHSELGRDGHFLPKPFQPTDLTRRVRQILDRAPSA